MFSLTKIKRKSSQRNANGSVSSTMSAVIPYLKSREIHFSVAHTISLQLLNAKSPYKIVKAQKIKASQSSHSDQSKWI